MTKYLNINTSALVMRLSLATILLAHSIYLKFMIFTLEGTAQYFNAIGLPEVLAYFVFFIEAVSGVALLLGFKTRFFSMIIIPIFLGATWAHSANGWLFINAGGGWEYPLFLTFMAIVQLGLGSGKYTSQFFLNKDKHT